LGRLYGYMFTCPKATSSILCDINTFEDFGTKVGIAFPMMQPEDPKVQEEFFKTDFPFFMGYLENKLKEKKNPEFLFLDQYTVADFFVIGMFKQFKMFPKLAQHIESSTEFPLVKAYLEKRLADLESKPKGDLKKPKLYYFDMDGRGSMIRLLLKNAKVDFEDVRIKMDQWPSYKEKFCLKQVPVLEIEGQELVQSDAIMQFLSLRYGYLSLKNDKYARILFLANTIRDIYGNFVSFFYSKLPEAKKAEMKGKYLKETIPLLFCAIEKRLKENKSQDYLVGRKYTMADFYMIGTAQWIILNPMAKDDFAPIMKNYPILKAYIEKRLTDFK